MIRILEFSKLSKSEGFKIFKLIFKAISIIREVLRDPQTQYKIKFLEILKLSNKICQIQAKPGQIRPINISRSLKT